MGVGVAEFVYGHVVVGMEVEEGVYYFGKLLSQNSIQ